MNSARLECVFQEHMYSLHKVLFLAIMTITLYFNEVKSFAQNMLNNSPEVSGNTQCATFMGVKVLQTVSHANPTAKSTCTVPTILKRFRS